MNKMYTNNSQVTFYIGLSSTLPNANGTGVTEPSGGGYARVAVGGFSSPSNGSITNSNNITFPVSTGTWFPSNAKAAYYVLFDGNGGGAHVLAAGRLAAQMEIGANVTIVIAAGTLNITLLGSMI